ncbi:hypothetical protein AMJ57_04995 [Parcubacteria bacterium SG8_24]|nr:MAG: hypothetical protein AMJ57_04995 [Parcubacteria bacterium SG8_24]
MKSDKPFRTDLLAAATGGRERWDDPGADALETGWEEFAVGTRVEVRCADLVWRPGTVVETPHENDRAIVVECDERYHDDLTFLNGRGATIMVYMNTYRGIRSNIRKIDT